MPTYEYACGACAHQWEQVQRITETPTEICPSCGKSEAHRLISAGTNFILKGSGWYSDLYSSAKPAASGAGGDAKTETKSEAKADKAEAKSGTSEGSGSSTTSTSTESTSSAPKTPSTPASS